MYMIKEMIIRVNLSESAKRKDWPKICPWESSKEKFIADQKTKKREPQKVSFAKILLIIPSSVLWADKTEVELFERRVSVTSAVKIAQHLIKRAPSQQ